MYQVTWTACSLLSTVFSGLCIFTPETLPIYDCSYTSSGMLFRRATNGTNNGEAARPVTQHDPAAAAPSRFRQPTDSCRYCQICRGGQASDPASSLFCLQPFVAACAVTIYPSCSYLVCLATQAITALFQAMYKLSAPVHLLPWTHVCCTFCYLAICADFSGDVS